MEWESWWLRNDLEVWCFPECLRKQGKRTEWVSAWPSPSDCFWEVGLVRGRSLWRAIGHWLPASLLLSLSSRQAHVDGTSLISLWLSLLLCMSTHQIRAVHNFGPLLEGRLWPWEAFGSMEDCQNWNAGFLGASLNHAPTHPHALSLSEATWRTFPCYLPKVPCGAGYSCIKGVIYK